jgi:putative membrane protein
MSSADTSPKDRATALAEQRTDLALHRTVIAAERTLMAWVRTSISMIGFGFTIYKFFQYQGEEVVVGKMRRPDAPRHLGMTLIAVGTLALIAAILQHRNFLRDIGASGVRRTKPITVVVAVVVVLIGILTFYSVWMHAGPF